MTVRPITKPQQDASCCFRTTVTHPGPNPARAGTTRRGWSRAATPRTKPRACGDHRRRPAAFRQPSADSNYFPRLGRSGCFSFVRSKSRRRVPRGRFGLVRGWPCELLLFTGVSFRYDCPACLWKPRSRRPASRPLGPPKPAGPGGGGRHSGHGRRSARRADGRRPVQPCHHRVPGKTVLHLRLLRPVSSAGGGAASAVRPRRWPSALRLG